MWGLAVSFDPSAWRLGKRDAVEGDRRAVGVWYLFGPIALYRDFR